MKIKQLLENEDRSEFDKKFSDLELYHGSNSGKEGLNQFKFRKGPSDTFKPFHNTVNNICKKKFGIPLRSVLFVTRSGNVAAGYGDDVFKVIPENGFRIFYSKEYIDMTTNLHVTSGGVESRLKNMFLENEAYLEGDEITDFYNIIGKFISKSGDYDLGNVGDEVISLYKSFLPDDKIEAVRKDVYNLFENMTKTAEQYVSTIAEAESSSDINTINDNAELMLYTPNGFNLIQQ